jgi:hypothetical protein
MENVYDEIDWDNLPEEVLSIVDGKKHSIIPPHSDV